VRPAASATPRNRNSDCFMHKSEGTLEPHSGKWFGALGVKRWRDLDGTVVRDLRDFKSRH
jgi:hypothetical protein